MLDLNNIRVEVAHEEFPVIVLKRQTISRCMVYVRVCVLIGLAIGRNLFERGFNSVQTTKHKEAELLCMGAEYDYKDSCFY